MDDIQLRAARIAKENGQSWVDDFHLLQAVLSKRGSLGARILRQCGLSHREISSEYRALVKGHSPPTTNAYAFTPNLDRAIGRAQGLAAGRGRAVPATRDYLAGILLEPGGLVSSIFGRRPESIACLGAALRDAGIRLPKSVFAPPRNAIKVSPNHLGDVLRALTELPQNPHLRIRRDLHGRFYVATRDPAIVRQIIDDVVARKRR